MSWLWNAITSPLRITKNGESASTPGCSPNREPLDKSNNLNAKSKSSLKLAINEI